MKSFLFIGVDQLRHDVVGPGKTVTVDTPHMDAPSANGVSFERTYETGSLCTPPRTLIFTGDHAFRSGTGTNCDMCRTQGTELAEPECLIRRNLQRTGLQCGSVGKWCIGSGQSDATAGCLTQSGQDR